VAAPWLKPARVLSGGTLKIKMEKKPDDLVNFTNIDTEEFIGTWGEERMGIDSIGNPTRLAVENKQYPVQAGETLRYLARYKAEAFAQHLAEKILIRKGEDFGDTNPEKAKLMQRMISEMADEQVAAAAEVIKAAEPDEKEFADIVEENVKVKQKKKS
jgi:hypothetical protein